MNLLKRHLSFLCSASLLLAAVLGCGRVAKQPDWPKAKKIAGKEHGLSHISGLVVDDKFAYVTIGGTIADQNEGHSGLRKVALDSGAVTNLDVADMREQIAQRDARLTVGRSGAVAVAAGEGIERLFAELGAHVVPGGETLNPSTFELLAGIHEVGTEEVIVLPSSSNVIMAAESACEFVALSMTREEVAEGMRRVAAFVPGPTM